MYYSEVKNLISIIKGKQEEFCKINRDSGDFQMEVDSKEERKNNNYEGAYYQNIGGKFIPIVPSHNNSRSKSA